MTTPSSPVKHDIFRRDRPGWIPEDVGDDWDPNPYAYQTEEQLMPAGRFHGLYLQMVAEMLQPVLGRQGLFVLLDVFIFYRDWEGRKQRIAPDALIAPVFTQIDDEQAARSYDLDVEPLPLCVIEINSPESSERDTLHKPFAYAFLGIREYLLLDIVDADGRLLPQVGIKLWRFATDEQAPVQADAEGYVQLETIGIRLRADGRRLVAQVISTGEFLRTSTDLTLALEQAEQARQQAEQRADEEAAARQQAEQARQQAEQARQQAEQRADEEAAGRRRAEDELARLRAELERLGGSQS
jgi:hypothetical protein